MPVCCRRISEQPPRSPHKPPGIRLLAVVYVFTAGTCVSPLSAEDRIDGGRHSEFSRQQIPIKVQRFAESTVRRHDSDGDGQLDSSEWTTMGGDPARIDRNGDGVITVDEYLRHLILYHGPARLQTTRGSTDAGIATRDPSSMTADVPLGDDQTAAASAAPATNPAAGPNTTQPGASKRFYVAPTRLPAATPQWFLALDRNGDAQLSLQEFLASGRTSQSFRELDHSGDGILTAAEAVGRGARRNETLNPEPD